MKLKIKSMIGNIREKEKKNIQSEQQEEKRIQKSEDSVRSLWDNFKLTNICTLWVLEGEEREQEIKNLFEKIMTESFLNLVKEIDIQVQEAQRVSNKISSKRPTPRYIIIKMPKVKDKKNPRSSKRKPVSYLHGSPHKTDS